jgi:hypothetical protein
MSDEPKPAAGRSYQMGDLGAGARAMQGDNNTMQGDTWIEGVTSLPDGEALTQQFNALLDRIGKDASLDEDTRALAQDKTKAVAEGLAKVQESPNMLRRALIDAKSWFGSTVSWVGNALGDILKSEAAQKTIGTVTEAATKAAIASFVK